MWLAPALSGPAWVKHPVAQGYAASSVLAADFTGDGRPDIVTGDGQRILLLVGPDWKPTVLAEGIALVRAEALDVDGDGDLDLVGEQSSPGLVFWLERPAQPLAEGWKFHWIDSPELGGPKEIAGLAIGDFNGSGRSAVAAASAASDGQWAESILIYERPSNPRQRDGWPRRVPSPGGAPGVPQSVAAGDLDGDRRPDLAAAAAFPPDGNWIAWWQNPGDPESVWKKQIVSGFEEGATDVVVADVNGDGRADIVASRGRSFGVYWFEAPSWRRHPIDSGIGGPRSLTAADLNLDGRTDVVTCAKNTVQCAWYQNVGQGDFIKYIIEAGQSALEIRLVDLDGDGDLDLLVAGGDTRNVVWFENPFGRRAAAR
jgi:hypothetical protein